MKNYRRSDLMLIYKSQFDRFNDTRNIQWKFNVAAWTLLAVAIYFKGTANICIPNWTVFLSSFILVMGHSLFSYLTQKSLNGSKAICDGILKVMNDYTDTIKIEVNVNKLGKDKKWKRKDTFWLLLQISFTVFLVVIFIWTKKL